MTMIHELPTPDGGLHNFRPHRPGSGRGRRQNQLAILQRYGLCPSSRVLEIGCGVGWLAYDLASRLSRDGGYATIELSETVIRWLNKNYAPHLPNFRFDLLDVKNTRYRPRGACKAEHVRFPYDDNEFDIACAFNVFVYMTEPEITRYLLEVARVVRPGGVGLITCKAIFDGDLGPETGMPYVRVADGVYTRQPTRDGWAMAYDDTLIRSMIDRAGLDLRSFEVGSWHTPAAGESSAEASGTPRPGADLYVVTPANQ